jgi:hypothetical protein
MLASNGTKNLKNNIMGKERNAKMLRRQVRQVMKEHAKDVLAPKPWWMPRFIWIAIVRLVIK